MNRKVKKMICTMALSAISMVGLAQDKFNYGLKTPQPDSTLPISKAVFRQPTRVKKKTAVTLLQKEKDGQWIISNGWELSPANTGMTGEQLSKENINTSSWYNATVPGTVLTTLVNQGVYADPYLGLNNLRIPDSLCKKEWWYRSSFNLPTIASGKRYELILNGINYKAAIWLNGHLLGNMQGAFVQGVFNATQYIKPKGNVIAVHIIPPPNPGIPHEESAKAGAGPNGGQLCLDGPTFISSEGWDWIPGIRDRNSGIWQDVRLKVSGTIAISNTQVLTDLPLPDTTKAALTIRCVLNNHEVAAQTVLLKGKIGNVSFQQEVKLAGNTAQSVEFTPAQFRQLNFIHPKLWWPNGYGNQPLYNLMLTVEDKQSATLDEATTRFGIRELSYELAAASTDSSIRRYEYNPLQYQQPVFDNLLRRNAGNNIQIPSLLANASLPEIKDNKNPYLTIKVNGVPIFCKGGNWGMDDGMKRCSRQQLEPAIRLHKEANFNMIRNWTGESTEEALFELCDEYGIMVWNDFWMSTGGYNLYPKDEQLFLENARQTVTRFRNHPSIVIWCARNEGWPEEHIEKGLANIIATVDGTRHYQPNSRSYNLRNSGPWHYLIDPAEYFRKNADGFSTELGTPSIPTANFFRKMMAKEDQWPINDVWYYHDLHDGQTSFRNALDSLYGKASSLDDFCSKAQLLNYESHRAMFEAWNSKLWNNASGLLLWMTHPAWPSMIWQVYSSDFETYAAYYASQRACEPIHIQMNLHDNKVLVSNTSLKNIEKANAELSAFDLSGRLILQKQVAASVAANSNTNLFTPDFSSVTAPVYLVKLVLKDGNNKIVSQNEYWKKSNGAKDFKQFNSLAKATLSASITKHANGKATIRIRNISNVPAIAVRANLLNKASGKPILPLYLSDSYFTLMPNEERILEATAQQPFNTNSISVTAEGYNLMLQTF